MAKIKILHKPKKYLENTHVRLRKKAKVIRHDPFKNLLDEELIAQAFWECLKENDPDGAMEIILSHIEAINKVNMAKESDIPRSTIYHSIKNKNPTIKTVAKLIHYCA